MMAIESRNHRLAVAGAKGGKASLETMTPEERSARAKAAAEARWGRATPEQVVSKMVCEIYRLRRPMALYKRDGALWFAAPDGFEARRWEQFLVGTYDVGVMEEDVMADARST